MDHSQPAYSELSALDNGDCQGIVDDEDRKLFVGGLAWTITEEMLRAYLEKRGEVPLSVQILRDRSTGRSRGFGFLTLIDNTAVDRILLASARGDLVLEGRRIEIKRAVTRHAIAHASRKLFVGGLSQEVHEGDFREYWARFGALVECVVMKDRVSGRSRGFGFVSFSDDTAVDRALLHPHIFGGKLVEVKVAEPKRMPPSNASVPFQPMSIPFPLSPQDPNVAPFAAMAAAAAMYAPPHFPFPAAQHAYDVGTAYAPVDAVQLHAYLHALMLAQVQLQAQSSTHLPPVASAKSPSPPTIMQNSQHSQMNSFGDEQMEQAGPESYTVGHPSRDARHTRIERILSPRKHDLRHSAPVPPARPRNRSKEQPVEFDQEQANPISSATTDPADPPVPSLSLTSASGSETGSSSSSGNGSASRVRLSAAASIPSQITSGGNTPSPPSVASPSPRNIIIKVSSSSPSDRSPGGSARSSRSSSRLPTAAVANPQHTSEGAGISNPPSLASSNAQSVTTNALTASPALSISSARKDATTAVSLGKPRTHSSPARWRSDLVPWKQSEESASETILKYFRSPTSSPGTTSPPSSSDTESSAMLRDDDDTYPSRQSRYSQYSSSTSHSHSQNTPSQSYSHSYSNSDEQQSRIPQQ